MMNVWWDNEKDEDMKKMVRFKKNRGFLFLFFMMNVWRYNEEEDEDMKKMVSF